MVVATLERNLLRLTRLFSFLFFIFLLKAQRIGHFHFRASLCLLFLIFLHLKIQNCFLEIASQNCAFQNFVKLPLTFGMA